MRSAPVADATISAAVTFEDVQRPVAMFAEGVLGRPVHLEMYERQPVSGHRPMTALSGELALVLPPQIETFERPELNRRAYRQIVLHQAGYELFGTAAFDAIRFISTNRDRPLLERVFALIEDRRIDATVLHHFPGAASDVHRARAASPRPSGQLAEVSDLLDQRTDLHRWSVDDSARLALALCPPGPAYEPTEADLQDLELESDPDRGTPSTSNSGAGDAEIVDGLDASVMTGLAFAIQVENLDAVTEVDGGGSGSSLPEESPSYGEVTSRREAGRRAGPHVVVQETSPLGADRTYLYDEWDQNARRYVPAWCRVHELPLPGGDPEFITDVRRRHGALVRQLRRRFSLITAESWRRMHRERDGAELDLDEVVSSMVDRRRGIIDEEHLHIRQERAAREVAAAFLLDMSGSTSSPVPDPDAPPEPTADSDPNADPPMWFEIDTSAKGRPPRTVLDVAKDSLALMCDALHVLGDDHAIYGFSGEGHDRVEFYVAKELSQAPSTRTWTRLSAMQSRRYTRMGPAIRHATWKLRNHAARTRLLVVVSDGYPQDRDYGPEPADRSYGIADTAKALEEAERSGVLTFCITVDPSGHDYLRTMCPDERYLVIDDVNALPDELTKLYRSFVQHRSGRTGTWRPAERP